MINKIVLTVIAYTHRNTRHRNPHPAVGTLRQQAKTRAEGRHAAANGAKPSIG